MLCIIKKIVWHIPVVMDNEAFTPPTFSNKLTKVKVGKKSFNNNNNNNEYIFDDNEKTHEHNERCENSINNNMP
ncbi:hypothetical protein DERF_005688 [Dermatophagoides farinae]|uniref:Uncharacterized protein n=1 Tax=Dermatophagoides farinae TaxID=6954 RepID=A0A922LBI6_DERFA|nr:hypothetical protein DERF_005688 [Dermatophagoides farinae]